MYLDTSGHDYDLTQKGEMLYVELKMGPKSDEKPVKIDDYDHKMRKKVMTKVKMLSRYHQFLNSSKRYIIYCYDEMRNKSQERDSFKTSSIN